MGNEIKPNPYSDSRTDAWWGEQQKSQAELEKRGYPDPRMTSGWDYQGRLMGYENGAEFKKEYFKTAGKAVGVGVAGGAGTYLTAFGLSAGAIVGAAELPAAVGFVARVGGKAIRVAKEAGVWAWNTAQSAWRWAMGTAATPQGQEVIGNTVECVGNLIPGSSLPTTKIGFQCAGAQKIKEALKDKLGDPEN